MESLYQERMGGGINIDLVCSSHASFELMNEHGTYINQPFFKQNKFSGATGKTDNVIERRPVIIKTGQIFCKVLFI